MISREISTRRSKRVKRAPLRIPGGHILLYLRKLDLSEILRLMKAQHLPDRVPAGPMRVAGFVAALEEVAAPGLARGVGDLADVRFQDLHWHTARDAPARRLRNLRFN